MTKESVESTNPKWNTKRAESRDRWHIIELESDGDETSVKVLSTNQQSISYRDRCFHQR